MEKEKFQIAFFYQPDQLKGTADIYKSLEDGETIYLARNIRLDNTQEEIAEANLVVEDEIRVRSVLDEDSDAISWMDADSEEASELASLIGKAIEKYER